MQAPYKNQIIISTVNFVFKSTTQIFIKHLLCAQHLEYFLFGGGGGRPKAPTPTPGTKCKPCFCHQSQCSNSPQFFSSSLTILIDHTCPCQCETQFLVHSYSPGGW